jgi:hypothetical protein
VNRHRKGSFLAWGFFGGFRIGRVPKFKEDFALSILLLAPVLMKLFNAKDFVVADKNHPTGCRHKENLK